jgi:phage-related holin
MVKTKPSLYIALKSVHFQEETSELGVPMYSFIRDNMVDQIEQKNKKDGMWSDSTSHQYE